MAACAAGSQWQYCTNCLVINIPKTSQIKVIAYLKTELQTMIATQSLVINQKKKRYLEGKSRI